jgi:uncharacterized small protein (TIGR04563 family)
MNGRAITSVEIAMPSYMRFSRIDWHYERATPDLQAVLRQANHELSSPYHTAETFENELRAVASTRRDLVADALVEDGFRAYRLYRARDGEVSATEVDERPDGVLGERVSLPFGDVASVTLRREVDHVRSMLQAQSDFDGGEGAEVDLPLCYDDESSMREVLGAVAKSIEGGEHRFVAEVGLDRFLVELRPGGATVRRLVFVTEPDLVAHLLLRRFADVPEPPPRPTETREQPVYLSQDMLQVIKNEALRLDKSLSWLVQKAWKIARPKVVTSDRQTLSALRLGPSGAKAQKQTVFFPGDMLVEIRDQATRLDSSVSFVVQSAWALASAAIAALPAPSE